MDIVSDSDHNNGMRKYIKDKFYIHCINIRIIPAVIIIELTVKIFKIGGARGVMVIVVGNGHDERAQILDETDSVSYSTNTLENGMNPIILPPAMSK